MFIYNVTTMVNTAVADDWLKWMQEIHIPEIMETGNFKEYKILRLLEVDDSDGPTYAVQFFADSKAAYNAYIEKHSKVLRQKTLDVWGAHIAAFRTLMQVVE